MLGGYDQTRASNDSVMIASPTDFSVRLQSIIIERHNDTVAVLDTGILADIDTAIPEFWLPPHVCDQIASALSLSFHEASNRYALTTMAHSALQKLDPVFGFRIGSDKQNSSAMSQRLPTRLLTSRPLIRTMQVGPSTSHYEEARTALSTPWAERFCKKSTWYAT